MANFGFKVLVRNTVSLNGESGGKWQQLVVTQPLLQGCIACGACTAVCPRAATHGLGVRKALLAIRRGQEPGMSPSDCLMCNKCALVCPRNMNTRLVWFCLEQMDEIK